MRDDGPDRPGRRGSRRRGAADPGPRAENSRPRTSRPVPGNSPVTLAIAGLLLLAGLAVASGWASAWLRGPAGAPGAVGTATAPGGPSGWLGNDLVRGRVTFVRDGDTVDVRSGERDLRVRVYGIDTPERGQPWAAKAKRFTADMVGNRDVLLRVRAKDKYDRTVAEVLLPDGRNLSEEILRAGLAWHYDFHSRDADWHRLMEEARAAGRGLWSDEKRCAGQTDCPTRPVSPRDFRVEERRAGRGPRAGAPPTAMRPGFGGAVGR